MKNLLFVLVLFSLSSSFAGLKEVGNGPLPDGRLCAQGELYTIHELNFLKALGQLPDEVYYEDGGFFVTEIAKTHEIFCVIEVDAND